jgi:hypothetical protein
MNIAETVMKFLRKDTVIAIAKSYLRNFYA